MFPEVELCQLELSELLKKHSEFVFSPKQNQGFTGSSEVKASACNVGDQGWIPELGRSPGEGNGNPLQYSCLENPMDGGAWQATVHGVTKSQTRQRLHFPSPKQNKNYPFNQQVPLYFSVSLKYFFNHTDIVFDEIDIYVTNCLRRNEKADSTHVRTCLANRLLN